MTLQETLVLLKDKGDEKMHAQNIKRGAGSNQYGVKMGDIRAIAKKIKSNHPLALELWETGNVDARLLSVLLMKPVELSVEQLEILVPSETYTWVADWLQSYIIKDHPEHEAMRVKWLTSTNPMLLRSAWSLTAGRIARNPEGIDIPSILDRIEREMPTAAPEVQWTMNIALAYTGIHHPEHRARALALGESMGIYRDYPVSKGCTSPFAPIWINEMVKRQG